MEEDLKENGKQPKKIKLKPASNFSRMVDISSQKFRKTQYVTNCS
jgi:hypothetical protein